MPEFILSRTETGKQAKSFCGLVILLVLGAIAFLIWKFDGCCRKKPEAGTQEEAPEEFEFLERKKEEAL